MANLYNMTQAAYEREKTMEREKTIEVKEIISVRAGPNNDTRHRKRDTALWTSRKTVITVPDSSGREERTRSTNERLSGQAPRNMNTAHSKR